MDDLMTNDTGPGFVQIGAATLFEKLDFSASSHARKLLSGIHLANFNEIPAKNMRE